MAGDAKWKAGMWRVEPFTSNPQFAAIVTTDGGISVAEVIGDEASPTVANVLASAPDLYAALEEMVDASEGRDCAGYEEAWAKLGSARSRARAARARARGEQP
jgi:hypothetical protein